MLRWPSAGRESDAPLACPPAGLFPPGVRHDEELTMLQLNLLREALETFPRDYMNDFDDFWKWKAMCESADGRILDDDHLAEAYRKLRGILGRWQYFRSGGGYVHDPGRTLGHSLRAMADAYSRIRECTLLQFGEVPSQPLRSIWHELGRVKEYDGGRNDWGDYSVISICKPLMLLWGQTLAFDARVRGHLPWGYDVSKYKYRWTFEEWKRVMESVQRDVTNNAELVDFIKEESSRKYGSDATPPYGRFLDVYYWISRPRWM